LTSRAGLLTIAQIMESIYLSERIDKYFPSPKSKQYGIPVPAKPDPNRIASPASLLEACETGVAAEIGNVSMYETA